MHGEAAALVRYPHKLRVTSHVLHQDVSLRWCQVRFLLNCFWALLLVRCLAKPKGRFSEGMSQKCCLEQLDFHLSLSICLNHLKTKSTGKSATESLSKFGSDYLVGPFGRERFGCCQVWACVTCFPILLEAFADPCKPNLEASLEGPLSGERRLRSCNRSRPGSLLIAI